MGSVEVNRREFLKGAAAGVALLFTADALSATETAGGAKQSGPAVKIGVIGAGAWGKEILAVLSRLPSVQVTAVCDVYEPSVEKAKKAAPKAAFSLDYRALLKSKDVEAVVIATPSHLRREVALAAVEAGKHVYCEAPLASSIEDARAIALAGKASKRVFQVGQQGRSNLLCNHIEKFVRAGCLGKIAQVYAQFNKKHSWRRMAPNAEREKALNWRLFKESSSGIIGEIGIHHIDLANRYLNVLPVSVMGFGSIMSYDDGRDVPDTVQCIIEYPNNVRMVLTSTLASSFAGDYTLFEGSDSSLLLRDNRGWMVKEADSPLLGWEVYARKEDCFDETGICMIADATKLLDEGKEPGKDGPVSPSKEPLYCAFENFVKSIREEAKCVCGPIDGYKATVAAIKSNEAVITGNKIAFQKEWFEL